MRRRFPMPIGQWEYRYRIVSVDMIYTGQREGHLVEVRTSFDLRPTSRGRKFTPLYTSTHSAQQAHDQHYHARASKSTTPSSPSHLDHHDDTHVEMDPRDTGAMTWTNKALLALQIMYLSSVLKDGYGSLESGDLSHT
jgi:hypothetical protein